MGTLSLKNSHFFRKLRFPCFFQCNNQIFFALKVTGNPPDNGFRLKSQLLKSGGLATCPLEMTPRIKKVHGLFFSIFCWSRIRQGLRTCLNLFFWMFQPKNSQIELDYCSKFWLPCWFEANLLSKLAKNFKPLWQKYARVPKHHGCQFLPPSNCIVLNQLESMV